MTDQIKRLPKWAQALLIEADITAQLKWPCDKEPEPILPQPETTVWSVAGNWVQSTWVGATGAGYKCEAETGFGRRLDGTYYATKRDALTALEWKIANKAASDLRDVRFEKRDFE